MCRAYLASLLEYLQGFHQRTQPLQSLARQLARLEEEFDAQWEADTVPGWSASEQQAATANGAATAAGALDVDAFDSVKELEQLGAPGLRCGFADSVSKAEHCTRRLAMCTTCGQRFAIAAGNGPRLKMLPVPNIDLVGCAGVQARRD